MIMELMIIMILILFSPPRHRLLQNEGVPCVIRIIFKKSPLIKLEVVLLVLLHLQPIAGNSQDTGKEGMTKEQNMG